MTVAVDASVDADLAEAFDHYEAQQSGLGVEFLDEFRRAVDLIIAHPGAWQRSNYRIDVVVFIGSHTACCTGLMSRSSGSSSLH